MTLHGSPPLHGSPCLTDHCITCSDEGTSMRVVAVDDTRGLALCVGEDGERATVEVALLGAVSVGESLLVHAGTALARLGDVA